MGRKMSPRYSQVMMVSGYIGLLEVCVWTGGRAYAKSQPNFPGWVVSPILVHMVLRYARFARARAPLLYLLTSFNVASRCILGLPGNTTSSTNAKQIKCDGALSCFIHSVKHCSISVHRDQFLRQMKENRKQKNFPFKKWLEILAEEDFPPKETSLQWEQGSIVLTAFVAVLAIKKCFFVGKTILQKILGKFVAVASNKSVKERKSR